jgi:hypothetical protein
MGGAARAHRSSALHGYGAPFSVFYLPTELAGCEELTKGGRQPVGSSGAGCVVVRLKLRPSGTVGGSSEG